MGKENFFAGVSGPEHRLTLKAMDIMQNGPSNVPSLKETEKADVVLVLGEDVTNTAPMLALSLRQASRVKPMELPIKMNIPTWHELAAMELIQDERGPFFVLTPSKLNWTTLPRPPTVMRPTISPGWALPLPMKLTTMRPPLKI